MKLKINVPKIRNTEITILLIPHVNKNIKSQKTTLYMLLFLGALLGMICTSLVFFFFESDDVEANLKNKITALKTVRENTELILDEISMLQETSNLFQSSLSQVIKSAHLGDEKVDILEKIDIESFVYRDEYEDLGNNSKELHDLQNLKTAMQESIKPMDLISETIIKQKDILTDVPVFWPVENKDGRVTMRFGFSEHPFTKEYYLHKGLDIAFGRGKPIVAAADGVVIKKWYHRGYGNNLVIKHDLSYRTRYGHFDKIFVEEGDRVVQGQVIGLMGSTGLSTGPHLHFEVQIGTRVVDPEKFLDRK